MSVSTVHGRVMDRSGNSDAAYLGRVEIASATQLGFMLSQFSPPYREYEVVVAGVEKPGANNFSPIILISTNGATFETAVSYISLNQHQTSTMTTVVGSGSSAAANLSFNLAFNLATATGRGGGDLIIRFKHGGSANVDQRVQAQWYFLTSASNEAWQMLSGSFASGPLVGLAIDSAAGAAFTARADVYGFGRGAS